MTPYTQGPGSVRLAFPRRRGDDPTQSFGGTVLQDFSPQARG